MTDDTDVKPEPGPAISMEEEKRRREAMSGGATNADYRPPQLDVTHPTTLQGLAVPERRWAVKEWIPLGALTIFGGDGGMGKSLLAQMLATAVATAQPWLGLHVARMKVLCVFCEDENGEIHRRQQAINQHLGIDFTDLEDVTWACQVGEDNAIVNYGTNESGFGRGLLEPTDLYRSIRRYIGENGIQLLILDSLHDLFPGNENSRPEVRRFTQFLTGIALDMDGAVVLTAHPSLSGLSSGSGLSGSTAWNNAVRSRLYLSRPEQDEDGEPDNDARVFGRKKANYASANESMKLHWRDGVFVRDDKPVGIVGAIDRRAQQRRCQDVFLDLLAKRGAEARPVSHKPKSGNFAAAEFAKHPHRQGFTKQDFHTAMEALFADGRIVVESYGDRPSRQFERIAATQTKE